MNVLLGPYLILASAWGVAVDIREPGPVAVPFDFRTNVESDRRFAARRATGATGQLKLPSGPSD